MIIQVEPINLNNYLKYFGPYVYYFYLKEDEENQKLVYSIRKIANQFNFIKTLEIDWKKYYSYHGKVKISKMYKVYLYSNGEKVKSLNNPNERFLNDLYVECIKLHNEKMQSKINKIGSKNKLKLLKNNQNVKSNVNKKKRQSDISQQNYRRRSLLKPLINIKIEQKPHENSNKCDHFHIVENKKLSNVHKERNKKAKLMKNKHKNQDLNNNKNTNKNRDNGILNFENTILNRTRYDLKNNALLHKDLSYESYSFKDTKSDIFISNNAENSILMQGSDVKCINSDTNNIKNINLIKINKPHKDQKSFAKYSQIKLSDLDERDIKINKANDFNIKVYNNITLNKPDHIHKDKSSEIKLSLLSKNIKSFKEYQKNHEEVNYKFYTSNLSNHLNTNKCSKSTEPTFLRTSVIVRNKKYEEKPQKDI